MLLAASQMPVARGLLSLRPDRKVLLDVWLIDKKTIEAIGRPLVTHNLIRLDVGLLHRSPRLPRGGLPRPPRMTEGVPPQWSCFGRGTAPFTWASAMAANRIRSRVPPNPHWAAALGRIEMARRLIGAGADVNARDNNAFTPLDATDYDRKSRRKAKLEIAELLREKGGMSKTRQREEPGM